MAGFHAGNETAVTLQFIGHHVGVHDNRCIEISEQDYQYRKYEVVPEAGIVGHCSAYLPSEKHRDEHNRLGENDRHHVGSIELKRNVLTYAAVLLVAHDTLGILYGHLSHSLQYGNRGHEDEVENDYLDNQHHHASDGLGPTHVELHQKRLGQAGR